MNKLGIFLTYDADGIIDDYIPYMLEDINQFLDRLIIVVNGVITPEGRRKLEKITKDIYVRENIGFDFCAWQDAMENYIGFPKIKEYDQLVLFNDSFFGPLRSFQEVFDKMDDTDLDFWGLTVHGEVETVRNLCPYGYRPRYIQTYFMAFNKRMLNDHAFQNYWTNIPVYTTFQEVAEKCSAVLTKYFEDMGFSWGVYTDTSDLETDRATNICHHAFNINEIISNRNYPIIKRKSFVLGKSRYLRHNTGSDLVNAVKYIEANTDYDMSLIYRHLARRYDIAEIKESINLNYVLNENSRDAFDEALAAKAIGIVSLNQIAQLSTYLGYMQNFPSELALVIITDSENHKTLIEEAISGLNLTSVLEVIQDPKATEYICAYKIGAEKYASKYEYFLFLHDIEKQPAEEPFVVQNSYIDALWQNLAFNKAYVGKVLQLLKNNDHLGMVLPPVPFHGTYYSKACAGYGDLSAAVEYWNQKLGANCRLQEDFSPISEGGMFWCKKEVIDRFKGAFTNSNPASSETEECFGQLLTKTFEYLLPYFTSQARLLSGWVMTSEYAASEIENLRYVMNSVYKVSYGVNDFGVNSFQRFLGKLRGCLKNSNNSNGEYMQTPQNKEVVLVEIGLKRAMQNFVRKKLGRNKND